MRFAIIISKLDPAAMNDKARFLESFPFKELAEEFDSNRVYELDGKEDNADSVKIYTINDRHVFRENLDKEIDADFFVFAHGAYGDALDFDSFVSVCFCAECYS